MLCCDSFLQFEGSESLSSGNLVHRSRPCSDLNGSSQSPAHSRTVAANQKQRRFSDYGEFVSRQGLWTQTPPCFKFSRHFFFLSRVSVAPSIPPPVSYTKRSHANSVESDRKGESASPVGAPDRRKSATASGVKRLTLSCKTSCSQQGAAGSLQCVCVCCRASLGGTRMFMSEQALSVTPWLFPTGRTAGEQKEFWEVFLIWNFQN